MEFALGITARTDFDDALALFARGADSLVSTLETKSPLFAAHAVPVLSASHWRVHILECESAVDSTGY